MRSGGQILIDQLALQGVDTVFMVPGESFLAALDALYDHPEMRVIVCRHEGGAAMMAEATGKLTGRPGICFATRGPGASNAMSGLHVAEQDQTPMILFVGMPQTSTEGRGAFQEIDIPQLFSSFVKWAAVIRTPDRVPELVARAFHVAMSGRPGPVVLGLPEDMLAALSEVRDARRSHTTDPVPNAYEIETLSGLFERSDNTLLIAGGPHWSAATQRRIEDFAERAEIPVATAFRCQDYIDNRHPCYVGHCGLTMEPTLAETIRSATLLIAIGTRLDEITTGGYSLIEPPSPAQFLVHVHPSADELGRAYSAELGIVASAYEFARVLEGMPAQPNAARRERRAGARAAFEAYNAPTKNPGGVDLAAAVKIASDTLPESAFVANGAGNYAAFVNRHFVYKGFRTQLAPASGSMGYGLPAGIAAALAEPRRPVVVWAGDGCLLMTGQELATAVQFGLKLIVIVANNGMYGTIRMHQERAFPGREIATGIRNPDFVAFARAFGVEGVRVETTAEFGPALEQAVAAPRSVLIELMLDSEAIAPGTTLSDLAKRNPAIE